MPLLQLTEECVVMSLQPYTTVVPVYFEQSAALRNGTSFTRWYLQMVKVFTCSRLIRFSWATREGD